MPEQQVMHGVGAQRCTAEVGKQNLPVAARRLAKPGLQHGHCGFGKRYTSFLSAFPNHTIKGASIACSASRAGGVCNCCCANVSSMRKVSRYELIVCGLACRCCMSRWVKNRSNSGAKLAIAVVMTGP